MLLTFLLTRVSPADPVDIMVGGVTDLTAQDREAIREAYELDRPLLFQFIELTWGVVRLDFGQSFFSHRPAIQLIAERIPNSLQLAVAGLLVALAIGVPLGVLAALFRGGPLRHGVRVTAVLLKALPPFFLGLFLC